jgi:heme O synthase-like polyprenyltransferase
VSLAVACALGAGLVALSARQLLAPSVAATRRVLLASLVYLPLLLAVLAVDK